MDRHHDRRLISYLHGELDAAAVRALEAQLARDAALRARLERLRGLWSGMRPAPPSAVPYGFGHRLLRRLEARSAEAQGAVLGWSLTPRWARALAGAALLVGIALGLGLGRPPASPATIADVSVSVAPAALVATPTMAPPLVAAATPAAPPGSVAASGPRVSADVASAATVAAAGEESVPLTGEATFAEDYWQALLGSQASGSARGEGAG